MSGFKASKDRLAFLLVAKAASDLKLKPVLIGLFRIMLYLLCLCSINGTTKLAWQHISLQYGSLNEAHCGDTLLRKSNSLQSITDYWQSAWSSKTSDSIIQWDLWCKTSDKMRFMLLLCLVIQLPFCIPWIKESFWISISII